MKKNKFIGFFIVMVVLSSFTYNLWSASAIVENIQDNSISLNDDIETSILAPGLVNMSQLSRYDYNSNLRSDRRFKWQIKEYERTDNFHVAEGDKKLKDGDNIIFLLGGNPELQRTEPHLWSQIYVNDVNARYPNIDIHGQAAFKFIQPVTLNLIENFTSEYYNSTPFLDYYANNFNYTQDFETEYYGEVFNYTKDGFFSYLENSPFVDRSQWTFPEEENIVIYENTQITQVNNQTNIRLIFDRASSFLNEMHYSASYINGTGHFAGVNFTLIRLHGWGLPYTITTWVVWIPILLFVVGLIIAFRLHAFQKLRLYLEARKLAKRE